MPGDTLTTEDWVEAALDAASGGGLGALSVERLATRLSVLPTSFYAHFDDQPALVNAVLLRWEDRETTQVIDALNEFPDPATRLRALFHHTHPVDGALAIEYAVLMAADNPQVAPVLRRVVARRLSFIADNLCQMGIGASYARQRAAYAYQTWLGYVHLVRALPELMPDGSEREQYVASMLATIESGWPEGNAPLA